MTLRRAFGLLVAPLLLVVGAAGAAAADSQVAPRTGNDGAWVQGVGQCDISSHHDCWAWIDRANGTPCPNGHFCIYEAAVAAEGGKVFAFYHCTDGGSDWALHGWNGPGYYHNSNSGGGHGRLKDVDHHVLLNSAPGTSGPYNFKRVWFVRAC
jgi:hypothetical protein